MNRIRVLVADDNPVVRSGLLALLELHDDVEVVADVGDGRQAIEQAERLRPDVVLLDVRMPVLDGVSAVEPISRLAPVLMLTHTEDAEVVRTAVRQGAGGYLVHGAFTTEELVAAVRAVAGGTQNPFSPVAVTALMTAVKSEPGGPAAAAPDRARFGLSLREGEVMELIAQGCTNREIAGRLFLTEKTVKNHVNRIFSKLGAENRAIAIARWLGTETAGR